MGTGAEIAVPLLLAGGATAATTLNNEQAARRADRIAAQGIRQQGVRQRQVDARVDQEIARVAGSDPEMERQQSNNAFLQQLRRARATAGGVPGVPGASSRYSEDLIAGDLAADTTAARVADLMARVNAPILAREREAQGFDQLRSDVGVLSRNAAGDDFLNQLRLRGVRPNPWIDAAAQVAGGYARARASRVGPMDPLEDPLLLPASSTTRRLPVYGTRLA